MRSVSRYAGAFPIAAILLFTGSAAALILGKVVWPAYQKPLNRTYESRFGYAALRRAMGGGAEVETVAVQRRQIVTRLLGEGRVTATPIRVPVIPTDRVISVHVEEGERVVQGQVLAELDSAQARLRLDSAELMVANAKAELERVRLGSEYTLTQERPEREGINLQASRKQVEILRERHASLLSLHEQGSASRLQLLELESKLAEAEREFQTNQLTVDVSSKGQSESKSIAENALKEQQNILEARRAELAEYVIRSPADGVVESVCIHPGEYNQGKGGVGFVLASGLWFEAHFDQTGIGKVAPGDAVDIQLEAFPGEAIKGTIARVVPIVTYSTAGPESNRPVRALGTGAPEWPTTFRVIVECAPTIRAKLAPGLTGFAKIESARDVLAVPRSAATILSSRQGFVNVVMGRDRTVRKVSFGETWQDWIEIADGLSPSERVAIGGHEALRADERFKEVACTP